MPPPNLGPQPGPATRPAGQRRPLTIGDIPRLDDAAVAKLIAQMEKATNLKPESAAFLNALKKESELREFWRKNRIQVDPDLIPLRPVPDPPFISPLPEDQKSRTERAVEYLARVLNGELDSQPPGVVVGVAEGVVVGSQPSRIFNWWLGGPAHSGGDVFTTEQFQQMMRGLNAQEQRALLLMLSIAGAIGKGEAGVVPMDKRDP